MNKKNTPVIRMDKIVDRKIKNNNCMKLFIYIKKKV